MYGELLHQRLLRIAGRRPLLAGADAVRALDAASRIFANGVQVAERSGVAAGSIDGFCAPVLLADALARAGRVPERTVHDLLRRALVVSTGDDGLYDGAAGLLVTLDAVDPERRALQSARARLRTLLAVSIRDAGPADPDRFDTYDLISGVAGRALALRDAEPEALSALCGYAERFADEVERRIAHGGEVNLGVAHGVPGMLAALNAAFPAPHPLAARYVELVLATAQPVGGAHRWHSRWWPGAVPPATRSWCYHTAGVAAVLYDRALLDGDDALRALAVRALDGVVHDDRDDPAPFWPSLCHGRAGTAVIAWHVAGEGERFAQLAQALAKTVLDEYDERRPLGYRSYDVGDGRGEERTDFLNASFGIALFLVDAATAHERRWLPLLGLLPD
jgi:lantibiotic biosynthesis protein